MGTPDRTVDVMDILRCLMVSERSRFMRFCEYCGTEIIEGTKFCTVCGNQIQPTFDVSKNIDNTNSDVTRKTAPQVKIDPAVVRKAMSGDAEAFQVLYEKTYRSNLYIARKYMKDDAAADDVLQDAYIKIWNNLSSLQAPEGFVNWARRIVATTALNELRKNTPILFGDLSEDGKDGENIEFEVEDTYVPNNPEISFVENEEQEIIREMINSLSDEQRMCVLMYYIEEMSVNEIAETIGCSTGTVKSRLNYGRKNVKAKAEELQKRGYNFKGLSALAVFVLLFRKGITDAAGMQFAIPASPVTTSAANAPANVTNSGGEVKAHSATNSAGQSTAQPVNQVSQVPKSPAPKAPSQGFLSAINMKIFIPVMAAIAVLGVGVIYLISRLPKDDEKASVGVGDVIEEDTDEDDEADEEDSEEYAISSDSDADESEETAEDDSEKGRDIASRSDEEAEDSMDQYEPATYTVEVADNSGSEIDVYELLNLGTKLHFLVDTLPDGQENFKGTPYDVKDNGATYTVTGTIKTLDIIMKDTGVEGMDDGTVTSYYGTVYTVISNDHGSNGNWCEIGLEDEDGNVYYVHSGFSGQALTSSFISVIDYDTGVGAVKTFEHVSFEVPTWSALTYPSGVLDGVGGEDLTDYQGMFLDENGVIHSSDLPEYED